jgi:acetylornithine deacetylase/succinyl-diaminopimelate desuccinylase-like protein
MLAGGHAENALPQRARATVNCRILPGQPPEEVLASLRRVVNDPGVTIEPLNAAKPSPPSPLTPELMQAIEDVTEEMWPGVPVVPTMSTGATDGLYLRQAGIPVYGVSGVFGDEADVRAHGRDERIRHDWFYEGLEFCYRLAKRVTAGEVM